MDATFRVVKTGQYPIEYLIILKKLFFSNQYEQHPILSICLVNRLLYNTIQYINDDTTDYLVRFCNLHKVNKAFNGSLISRGFQEHGIKIIYQLHVTGFDSILDDYNKESDKAGE